MRPDRLPPNPPLPSFFHLFRPGSAWQVEWKWHETGEYADPERIIRHREHFLYPQQSNITPIQMFSRVGSTLPTLRAKDTRDGNATDCLPPLCLLFKATMLPRHRATAPLSCQISIFPGFITLFGSNAALIFFIMAISTGGLYRTSSSRFNAPRPCSADIVPLNAATLS